MITTANALLSLKVSS